MSRATVAQKEGDFRAPYEGLSDPQKLVYDELGAVGTREKSLRPSVLEKYSGLLASPAVTGRVPRAASKTQLAEAAAEALADAINEIVLPDRPIAEAVLASGEFAGLLVKQRKQMLETDEGISSDRYKRRRSPVLADLVRLLFREPQCRRGEEWQHGLPGKYNESPRHKQLVDLARKAAALHHAGLALFFVWERGGLIDTMELDSGSHLAMRNACQRALFQAYDNIRPLAFINKREPFHARPVEDHVLALVHEVRDHGRPTDIGNYLDQYDPSRLQELISDSKVIYHEIPRYFRGAWMDWCHRQLRDREKRVAAADQQGLNQLEHVVVQSLRLARLTNDALAVRYPILTDARRTFRRLLCGFYPYDEWAPILNGRSFTDHIHDYFHMEAARLTELPNSAI
jgi:hypothetical protein